jgi:beta-glucosidase
VDTALTRLFEARLRNGDLPARPVAAAPSAALLTPAHRALALQSAEEAIVLLKNDGRLPLAADARLLVVGPLADATRVLRGNYSSPLSGTPVSVLDGLRTAMPAARITHLAAAPSPTDGDPVPTGTLLTPDGKPGIRIDYFNVIGTPPTPLSADELKASAAAMRFGPKPAVSRIEPSVNDWARAYSEVADHHRFVGTGFLVPPETGTYRIKLTGGGSGFEFDGKMIGQTPA